MAFSDIKTNPAELLKFKAMLMKYAPKGFCPFYFLLGIGGKEPKAGKSWKKSRITVHEALYWMMKGYNIAICATDKDPHCIADVDDLSQVPDIKSTLQVKKSRFIFLKHYKSGIVYLSKVRQEDSWQVDGQKDRGDL